MADRIQIRRVYTANWNGETPLIGEFALETDASPPKLRVGDGSTAGGRLVGAAAVQIGVRAISTATPDDGDTLVYDQASNTFVYAPGGGSGSGGWTETTSGSDATPTTTNITVSVSTHTSVVLYADAASLNVRLDCSATEPVLVVVRVRNKRNSGSVALTVSLNSATAWVGVVRPAGSLVLTDVQNAWDVVQLVYSPGLSRLDIVNVVQQLV